MVSFFGLRFGSDKKKAQNKQSDKKQAPQQRQPQQWNRADQTAAGDAHHLGHNFSRPQMPSSRPGTSQSTTTRNNNWRATFKELAATSSMVDLTSPGRKPSVSSLRLVTDTNGKKPWMKSNASATSLVMPDPFGPNGSRPGTPGRPTGTRKLDWVNPLDVHFSKDPSSAVRSGTPTGATHGAAVKSPLSQSGFSMGGEQDYDDLADIGEPGPAIISGRTGYPSPPQSIDHGDQQSQFSPIDLGNSQNPSNTLGAVDRFGPASLPSPSPSTSRTSDDQGDVPVIRNVQAKRDTFTFLSPRRRSFQMEIGAEDLERHRQQQHPIEGFAGNFADFDFGDVVAKPAAAAAAAIVTVTVTVGTLGIELCESPIEMTEPNPFRDEKRDVRGRSTSEPRETFTKPPQQYPSSPQQRPQNQQQRQRSPPQPVAASPQRTWPTPTGRPMVPEPSGSPRGDVRPPLSVTTAAPQGTGADGFARVPPKGFNSRLASDTRSRGPPQPLRPAALSGLATRVDAAMQSPRSPYGPPAKDGNYLRLDEAPLPPPDRPLPERPLPSPLATRTPLEGDFPVFKGLPRGRQPPRSPLAYDEAPQGQAEERGERCLPPFWGFDRSEPRHSAMPAPLSPVARQPSSPSWSASTPTSATAPRIPSPTFPSLEKAISSTSEELAKSFDISFDLPPPSPLANEFSALDAGASPSLKANPMRVEAKKAPPRPAPVTLPPSGGNTRAPDRKGSPTRPKIEVQTNFI